MKVIDLLNKIANGEEVPTKIRITDVDDRITTHYNFFYDEDDQEYKDDELFPLGARLILDRVLNKKVEIIEGYKKLEKYQKALDKTTSEKMDLENIIKEVREYILTHKLYCFKYDDEELFEITTDKKAKDELLEILDKGE